MCPFAGRIVDIRVGVIEDEGGVRRLRQGRRGAQSISNRDVAWGVPVGTHDLRVLARVGWGPVVEETAMQLIEIGDARVVSVHPEDSIDTAIELMEENGFRHLPVVDRGVVCGMVSDRDLLRSVAMQVGADRVNVREGPARVGARLVSQAMSSPAVTAPADAPLEVAAETMLREGIRALPLIYKGRMAGIVTETDFLKCYLEGRPMGHRFGWRQAKVMAHMSSPVIALRSRDSFVHAVRTMEANRLRHLPIVDEGKLIGIVSDRDMRRVLGGLEISAAEEATGELAPRPTVVMDDIMTREVETINPSATLAEAADRLVNGKFGSLPVVSDGSLVGIITEADLLRVFVGAFQK